MSNYINVLRRLERERRTVEPPPAPVAATVPAREIPTHVQVSPPPPEIIAPVIQPARTVIPLPNVTPAAPPPLPTPALPAARPEPIATAPVEPAVRPATARRSMALVTETHPGIANLLDRIRAISSERPNRVVVFCGASTAEAVNALAGALVTHAERCGMRAFIGMLTRTSAGALITPASPAATSAPALGVDLDAGVSEAALRQWVEQVAPGSDLVVLTGPPLATSIDAALLACASDGLVIVAESEVTERAALQTAADRARIAGCRTLGVVMHGTKDRLPGWIRRIVGDRSTAHAPRED